MSVEGSNNVLNLKLDSSNLLCDGKEIKKNFFTLKKWSQHMDAVFEWILELVREVTIHSEKYSLLFCVHVWTYGRKKLSMWIMIHIREAFNFIIMILVFIFLSFSWPFACYPICLAAYFSLSSNFSYSPPFSDHFFALSLSLFLLILD